MKEDQVLQVPHTTLNSRGERLYPAKNTRNYCVLTGLRKAFERVSSIYLSNRPIKLVDFGCGGMPYRPLLTPFVDEYIGCDLDGNLLADRIMTDPDTLPFEDGFADVVLSSQVLEHTVDPVVYLNECWRVLKPNGLLILSTHGVWRYHPDPFDYWRWTSSGLKRTVELVGFSIRDFEGILGPAATGLQLWQDATLPRLHWRLRSSFSWLIQRWISAADRSCSSEIRNDDASVYVVVAAKQA